MQKVLLINPPSLSNYKNINPKKVGVILPSLGILYIASYLKYKGIEIDFIDLTFEHTANPKQLIINQINLFKPDIIAIGATTLQISQAFKICDIVKNINPGIKTIVGGYHPSALPEETLSHSSIDYVIKGEGEETLLQLCQNDKITNIRGIYYKKKNKIFKTPSRSLIKNLDRLPYPFHDKKYISKYKYMFLGNTMPVLFSRGCPFNCTFCASKVVNQGKIRYRNPDNVIDEIEYYYKEYKMKNFFFCDETFTCNRKFVFELCDKILKKDLKIMWTCQSRADTLSMDLLKLMKKAGCKVIEIGIESGNEKILQLINKKISLDKIKKTIKNIRKAGIRVCGLFILGLPGETKKTLRQTLDFAIKNPFDYAQFSTLVPLPGSHVWQLFKKGYFIHNWNGEWEDFICYGKPLMWTKDISRKDIENFYFTAYKQFYLNSRYILRAIFNIKLSNLLLYIQQFFEFLKFILFRR